MSEEFDKKLINRIHEVFDDFEDDSANEGWAELRKNFPVKERKPTALWWYSSAAALLLITSVWYFSNNDIIKQKPIETVQKQKEIKSGEPEELTKRSIVDTIKSTYSENKIAVADSHARSQSYTGAERITPKQKRKSSPHIRSQENDKVESYLNVVKHQQVKSDSVEERISIQAKPSILGHPQPFAQHRGEIQHQVVTDKILSDRTMVKTDSVKAFLPTNTNPPTEEIALSQNSKSETQPKVAFEKQSPRSEHFKADSIQSTSTNVDPSASKQSIVMAQKIKDDVQPKITSDKKMSDPSSKAKNKKSKAEKNVIIGFYAGSFANYAKGSETSLNTGFGFSSDIRLSNKIKISTGISLAQNTLSFTKSSVPDELVTFLALERNQPGFSNSFGYSVGASELSSMRSSNIISSYSINTYDAKLVGFDIPLNIKYNLVNKRNLIFISTGFSSNIYINESYNYNYDYKTGGFNAQNIKNLESKSKSQSYNIGQVVNLSLGFERPFSNNTRLSLEPFLKYPISGLGSHDLRFGAAGVNLKLNFNRSK
ncbi:MAG TPA: hypothetical protein VGB63_01825 [Pedobacter sp.]|jgi:hypothetical protein